ncbi:MAG: amidohydrolase [Planctomycetes bacterium]|nr:amidohydrolase [Planctomycetota bacterium]
MKPAALIVAVLCFCLSAAVSTSLADPPISMAITNARVWTGNPDQPQARTILISGERIVQVGDDALLDKVPKGSATIIDAGGRRVIPGLVDCHTHIISGGLALKKLQLRDAGSKEDFIRRVKEYAAERKPDEWVVGRGWSAESWPIAVQPTKKWIDAATGERPALLTRMDGHQALANSKALAMAGITKDTPDPAGGVIVRDPKTGEPTGILKDAASGLVGRLIPEPSNMQKLTALQDAKALFNRHGVTMIHDMSSPGDGEVFIAARTLPTLAPVKEQLRIYSFCQTSKWSSNACFELPQDGKSSLADWVRPAGFKGYMDGSLGSRTAYMRRPFLDNPAYEKDVRGLLVGFATRKAPDDMLSQFRRAARSSLQSAVHAIGDEGNHLLLNAYETVVAEFPKARPRIEHAQHLLAADLPRFGRLGVIASMQPYHKADDGRYAEKRIGYERCKTSYAFKSLIDSGAVVCFGSDWPVVSNNPFLGIHAAVTGKTLDGKIFVPEQNITVEQALRCYTTSAAYACFMEDRLGMIKPGYLADIVILNEDVLSIPAARIADVTVYTTIVDGAIAWQNNPAKPQIKP